MQLPQIDQRDLVFERRCYHRERMCGGACQESHLCCVRFLHDQLHLPRDRGLDLGRRLARQHLRCGLHGFCRLRQISGQHLNMYY